MLTENVDFVTNSTNIDGEWMRQIIFIDWRFHTEFIWMQKKFGKNVAFKNLEFIGTVINIFLWKADIIVLLVLINSKELSKENSFNEFLYYIKLLENRNNYVQASAIR